MPTALFGYVETFEVVGHNNQIAADKKKFIKFKFRLRKSFCETDPG